MDSYKYDTIFNFVAELKKTAGLLFKKVFIDNKDKFAFLSEEDVKETIIALGDNAFATKKVYAILKNKILDTFEVEKFLEFANEQGILGIKTMNENGVQKILVQKS